MRILFVHTYPATFVQIDLEILCSQHEAYELYVWKGQLYNWIGHILKTMKKVFWADTIFVWFGSYHALLPFLLGRLLGRKCVIVASGYDVANMPEINYGNMRPGIRRIMGRFIFRLADKVFAVSDFTRNEAIHNVGVLPTKIVTIYHGIDATDFTHYNPGVKENIVVTVGAIDRDRLTIKGLLNFVKVAVAMPEVRFILIGGCIDGSIEELKQIAPHNLEFAGAMYGDDLIQQLQRAKVYVQASAYESFGMAVAEAMLCGCIPVVTERGALPEVVGETGYIVPYGDLSAMAEAIKKALAADEDAQKRCQEWIQQQYPYEKRKKALLHQLEAL